MKKTLFILLSVTLICCSIFCFPVGAIANTPNKDTTIEKLENGDYIETIITYYETDDKAATKSGSKTRNYKNSDGVTLWSVTVNGTFTYNGTTSSCTKSTHSTSVSASNWSIKSSSSSKSGNCATATATATHKQILTSKDYTISVNLYCSPYGILS